jgi:hypothetical protein
MAVVRCVMYLFQRPNDPMTPVTNDRLDQFLIGLFWSFGR